MEKSFNEIIIVKDNTSQSGKNLLDIVHYMDGLLDHISQVVMAVQQQSATINSAAENLNIITNLAQEIENSSDSSHMNSTEVLKLAKNLEDTISYFKISS